MNPLRFFTRFLYALNARCAKCRTPIGTSDSGTGVCASCLADFNQRTTGFCPGCGQIYGHEDSVYLCAACRKKPKPWDQIAFYGLYTGALSEAIQDYKFNGRMGLGRALAHCLCLAFDAHLAGAKFDVLVPVPLHPARLRSRGFNQSLEIARPLAKKLGVPLAASAIQRVRHTAVQSGLNAKERANNVHGAFLAEKESLTGHSILLVDDVATTGSTLAECCLALQKAGAAHVSVLTVARA